MDTDMFGRKKCIKCLLRDFSPEDEYKSITNYLAGIRNDERAPENIYNERLEICRECSYLNQGTCAKCGCYVEIRAAYLENECPDVKSRWGRVNPR